MRQILVCALVLALSFPVAWAAAPRTFSYQGVLTGTDGVVVPDGNYNMTFRIYNVASGGTHLWQETLLVSVASGRFNVVLGKTTSLDALPFDAAYWLGVKVESDAEMSPRVELTGSPYAFIARTVENNAITSSKVANSTVVRSLNGLKDDVDLVAGSNVTITPVGNDIQIAATGAGADNDWVISGSNMYAGVSGNVGIGTTSPGNKLDVVVNNDVAIAQVRSLLGMGAAQVTVANSGSGRLDMTTYGPDWTLPWAGVPMANLSWLFSGVYPLMFVGQPIYTVVDNKVKSKVTGTEFDFFGTGLSNRIVSVDKGLVGGRIRVMDDAGNTEAELRSDTDGVGGSLWLSRDDLGGVGIALDGNYIGGEPVLGVYGSTGRQVVCDMSKEGSSSVMVPIDAIETYEILDDPGVTNNGESASVDIPENTYVNLLTRSIIAPTNGYALVIATGEVTINNGEGEATTSAEFGVSKSWTVLPPTSSSRVQVPRDDFGGTTITPVTVHGVFSVSAGTNTFYFVGRGGDYSHYGDVSVQRRQLTVVFIRSAYGTVEPSAVVAGGATGDVAPPSGPELAAERAASEQANMARIQRELEEMEMRVRQLETERAREKR